VTPSNLRTRILNNKTQLTEIFGKKASSYRIFWVVLPVTLAADQATKFLVHNHPALPLNQYPPQGGIEVIPGFFNLVFVTNTGAAWGLFAGQGFLLALMALAALAAVFYYRKELQFELPAMQLSFGLICGGIVGNLVDRALHGYVIDFFDFLLAGYRWPTFNLADSGICIGAALYLLNSFCNRKPDHDSSLEPH